MRAYSQDLRGRIVRAVEGGISRAEAARRFSVGERTVRRYMHRQTATGSLAPAAYRRGPAPAIPPGHEPALLAQLRAHPDATLAEHCAMWEREQGRAVSASTMCRAQRRVGWTHKKSRSSPASRTRRRGRHGGRGWRTCRRSGWSSWTRRGRTRA